MHSIVSAFRRLPIFVAGCLVLAAEAAAQMPRVELSAGIHRIVAEVANSEADRQQGLMHRKSMGAQEGMVFLFPQSGRVCMWMRNTLIPLSVAFIDESGSIINIADMTPQSEVSHCARRPAKFALEMNQGWFAQRGLGAGTRIVGLDRLPPAR